MRNVRHSIVRNQAARKKLIGAISGLFLFYTTRTEEFPEAFKINSALFAILLKVNAIRENLYRIPGTCVNSVETPNSCTT